MKTRLIKKALTAALAAAMTVMSVGLASCGSSAAKYTVGICQLVQHPALDAATEGFKAALTEKLGSDVKPTCGVIVGNFVSANVDLIFANATPALQAAAAATDKIPIIGTSITDYATALDMDNWTGKTGRNITGTSDLAPLAEQAKMIAELCPDAKTVGILYCSAEANSKYQATVVAAELEKLGIASKEFTSADSNDLAAVTTAACREVDALYVPTDNMLASNAAIIDSVALPAGIPVVAGEEGICKGCGVATLTISYYDIGYKTGEMAYDILVNGADPATMPIEYAPQFTPKYNPTMCEALGLTPPDGYEAIAE